MTKKKVSKLFNNNIFWAIISLLSALCIWVYLTGTQQEIITNSLNGVEVVFSGEEALQSQRGLVITDVSDQTVDVTISGTRLNISGLSASDVKAVIDVSGYSRATSVSMSYTLVYPDRVDSSEISIVSASTRNISFRLTQMDTEDVLVEVAFTGSVAEGYLLGDVEYEPGTIQVSGPRSVLDTIDHAYAEISLTDLSETRTVDSGFVLYDAEGNEIDQSGLEFNVSTISVTIPVSVIKTVPIVPTFTEGAGATSANTRYTLDVEEITIAGEASVVDAINRIEVGPIDLASFELTSEFELRVVLPNDVENISGIETVRVTVEITGLEVRDYTITNIDYTGLPENYAAELVTHSLTVTLRGSPESLDRISSNNTTINLRAVADLSKTTATGTMDTSNVEIFVDGVTDVGAVGTYRLTFNITNT